MRPRPPEEALVVADLRAAGLDVDTLDPLVNTTIDIRPGLPVLLDWLERAQDSSVRQMIVRALTDRRVRGSAAPALVRAFRRPLWGRENRAEPFPRLHHES